MHNPEIKKVKVKDLVLNPINPRTIKDEKFKQLKKSISEFPEMLGARPIVVNSKMEVLGGNMRLRAMLDLGIEYADVVVTNFTDEQQAEFIIKDNLSFGEWDWDALANEWDSEKLQDWGLDIPVFDDSQGEARETESENNYSKKIAAPIYEPKNEKPDYLSLFNNERTNELIQEIQESNIPQSEKDFLTIAATRHTVFNYERIADFYAHSSLEVQKLMEESALVIIDFQKAIELGYVKLSEEIANLYNEEYPDDEE